MICGLIWPVWFQNDAELVIEVTLEKQSDLFRSLFASLS